MVEVTVRVDASTRAALEAASSSAVASTAELTSQSDHRVEAEMGWVLIKSAIWTQACPTYRSGPSMLTVRLQEVAVRTTPASPYAATGALAHSVESQWVTPVLAHSVESQWVTPVLDAESQCVTPALTGVA